MFTVAFETYTLLCLPDGLPDLYMSFAQHARLVDEVDLPGRDGKTCFVAVRRDMGWPFLVTAQRYSPAGHSFHPGATIIRRRRYSSSGPVSESQPTT